MRSRTCVAASEGADDATGTVPRALSQRRKPTVVPSETTKTIAAADAASCGIESSQLRLIQPDQLLAGGRVAAAVAVSCVSASITLRMRSHRAFVLGGALYSPR